MGKQIKLAEKDKCTGCSACADICPTNSITLRTEGLHDFPVIADTCIQCGKCMRACPILNKKQAFEISEQKYYCAWNKDDKERQSSTSGGAGSALASWAIRNGYYVCGARFDNNWNLKHEVSNEESIIAGFRGSKYLKSSTEGVLRQIKSIIDEGNKVLFTGTPCQCDAITHYLSDVEKEGLITVSIICHGVNSSLVWKDYVESLEENAHSQLVEYNFRSKSKGWRQDRGGGGKLRVYKRMANGKESDVPSWRNLFHCWFGFHYILRPSCFHCPYRVKQRESDITIGDFWGISKVLPELDAQKGVSVVITSTEKGEQFIRGCNNLHYERVDTAKTESVLKGFVEKRREEQIVSEIEINKKFEQDYTSVGFEEMARRYPAETYLKRIIASLKSRLHI